MNDHVPVPKTRILQWASGWTAERYVHTLSGAGEDWISCYHDEDPNYSPKLYMDRFIPRKYTTREEAVAAVMKWRQEWRDKYADAYPISTEEIP